MAKGGLADILMQLPRHETGSVDARAVIRYRAVTLCGARRGADR
jgi:hypothetical protein